jgi:hypothetical protein
MGFYAGRGTNQTVSPAAASASITLDKQAKAVRVHNAGSNVCFIRIGTSVSGAPATTADTPVPAGAVVVLRKGDGEDTLSHISAAGTTPVYVQTGEEY